MCKSQHLTPKEDQQLTLVIVGLKNQQLLKAQLHQPLHFLMKDLQERLR